IFELLVHTSGIPAWYPLYLVSEELEKKIEFIGGLKPKFERNQGVEYSCLNYIILGELIRRVSGMSLNEFSRRRVFEPLSMKETFFLPPDRFKERFVTTEIGNGYEKETSAQYVQGVKVEWREYPIRGEVHDGNSFYGFGGVSGNAGLFSTARDIAKFIRSILTKKSVISDKSIDLMIENHTLHLDQGRGLGWAIASKFAGKNFSRKTFGHTGFTGVSLYADPQTELFVILLTNAVHPKVRRGILDQVRPEVCNLAYQEAISKSKSRR
ncbi:MAG: serine hydrolase domain-containing protein, partial [candidate division WOR-3 bacterium]